MLLQHEDSMCEGVIFAGALYLWAFYFENYINLSNTECEMRNAKCEMQNAKCEMQKCEMQKCEMQKCKMRKCEMQKCKMRKKQSHSLPSLRGGAKPPAAAWGWGFLFHNPLLQILCQVAAHLLAGILSCHLCHVAVNHDLDELLKACLARVPSQLGLCLGGVTP